MPTFRVPHVSVFSLVFAVLAACADTPSAPGASPGADVSRGEAHRQWEVPNERSYHVVECVGRGPRTGSMVIGPDGGTLRLGPNALFVPPGALAEPVTISATVADTVAAITFEPEGLQFSRPVIVELDTRGCAVSDEQHPVLLYLDDDGEARETIRGYLDERKQRFYAPVVHFSVYAIGV
jgi:hypothetical protein